MYGEVEKRRNKTPLIYTDELLHYKERDKFIDELSALYNKYGVDSILEIHDFILAESTWNFIATIHNARRAKLKLM